MRTHITRSGLVLAVTALAFSLVACSGAASTANNSDAGNSASSAADKPAEKPEEGSGDGDYAFGTDRDQMATAIEQAFSSDKAKASWDGDTFVLAFGEGDANEKMAGFTQCRVLMHLLNEEDVSVIEFPNGRVACADVLAED